MKITRISQNIKVMFLQAKSFPEGIMAAFEELRALIPGSEVRSCYGISRPEKDGIRYWVGVEELYPGEAEMLHCQTMILYKGEYVSAVIHHFMKDPGEIGRTFKQLMNEPGLDPNGFCVEWYFNETDVKCMIRKRD